MEVEARFIRDLKREAFRRKSAGTEQALVTQVVGGHWSSSSAPTQTHLDGYRFASQAFAPVLADLRKLIEVDLKSLEDKLESAGAPWTPGRLPSWQPE